MKLGVVLLVTGGLHVIVTLLMPSQAPALLWAGKVQQERGMGTLDTALGSEHGHWRQLVTPGWDTVRS